MARRLLVCMAAATLVLPSGAALANAPRHHKPVCRYSKGTTGLVAGGVAGAVVGGKLIGGGIAGPVVGAVGGALAGRAIDRTITKKKRCR